MIVLRGIERFVAGVDLKVEQMRRATALATARALHVIERRTKQMLRTYTHRAGELTPSGPGDPPALVTGNLRRSITVTGPEPIGRNAWRGQVGPTAVYGRIQELGGEIHTSRSSSMVMMGVTGSGIRLPARPYLRPSYEASREEIAEVFRKAWIAAILK